MKSILCGCVGLLALASTLAAQGSASAPLRAQIPWPFFVGDKQMPAGDYRFVPQDKALMVASESNGQLVMRVLQLRALAKVDSETDKAVFNKYGDGRIFLTQIIHSGSAVANQTIKGKKERESVTTSLHSSNYPTKVIIVATR